jgi:hypothetical protein
MNIFIDRAGVIRKRPGLTSWPGVSTAVIDANGLSGIHRCLNGDIYAVGAVGSERPIYRLVGPSITTLNSAVPPAGLRGSGRPIFAETEMLLVLAGGDAMEKILLSTGESSRMGDSPPIGTHVVTQALRLLANDTVVDRTKVRYSDTAIGTTDYSGNELWTPGPHTTASFFTAEARPDPIVAIAENTNSILLFGSSTLEIWTSDPTYIFTRTGAIEWGISQPYSVVRRETEFYWLDHSTRIVKFEGGSIDVISDSIQATLNTLDPRGCFGYRVNTSTIDAVVWTFPNDGRTFAYQIGVGWSQWHGWDGEVATQFPVSCLNASTLVGTTDGRIGRISNEEFTDFGEPIRCYVETGYVSRDTDAVKDCQRVLLSLKRGQTEGTAQVVLRYRDRPGAWEPPLTVDLGDVGDTEIVVDLPSLGTYRRRQWSIEFTGTAEFGLVSAVEFYEVTEA